MKFSWKTCPRPIVALAPMAGITDSPYRQIVKTLCPAVICVTELVSADGIFYDSAKTLRLVEFTKIEQPLIIQLFGNTPEHFADAIKKMEAHGVAGIDLNFGCPAKKVIQSEHGSALIKKPKMVEKIIRTCVQTTKLPISVKTRIGFDDYDEKAFLAFCKVVEEAGAQCLTLHGRTTRQGFSGQAAWEPMYKAKSILKIPVIGNGDIDSVAKAHEQLENLDGIMIGRGAFGNPWLVGEIVNALQGASHTPTPKIFSEKIPAILRHCTLAVQHHGEYIGMNEMRKHLIAYTKGVPHAAAFRGALGQVKKIEDVKKVLMELGGK